MGSYLGVAMANLINTLNPEMIVVGGGVSAAGDLGYTYGKATWKKGDATEPADYLRIWEKHGSTWKLAMDEITSAGPPPPPPTPPKKDGP